MKKNQIYSIIFLIVLLILFLIILTLILDSINWDLFIVIDIDNPEWNSTIIKQTNGKILNHIVSYHVLLTKKE